MKTLRLTLASTYAAILSGLGALALTIGAEQYAPLKNWLKSVSGHHWATKSLFVAGGYVFFLLIFFWLIKTTDEQKVARALWKMFALVILFTVALLAFFTWHFFGV